MACREGTIVKPVLAVILAASRVGPSKAALIFCLHFHTVHSCLSVIRKMATSLIPNVIQDSPSNNSPLKMLCVATIADCGWLQLFTHCKNSLVRVDHFSPPLLRLP